MYLVGRRLGPHALKRLSPARRERVERLFQRHGLKLVPAARFITLLRFPVFMLSGAHRLPYKRFLAYDALGLAGSATLMLGLGHAFASRLPTLIAWLSQFRSYALVGAGALVAATATIALLRARRTRNTPVQPVSTRTPSLVPPAE
jgi:membrane protein DedA with SNARE-associated domain